MVDRVREENEPVAAPWAGSLGDLVGLRRLEGLRGLSCPAGLEEAPMRCRKDRRWRRRWTRLCMRDLAASVVRKKKDPK